MKKVISLTISLIVILAVTAYIAGLTEYVYYKATRGVPNASSVSHIHVIFRDIRRVVPDNYKGIYFLYKQSEIPNAYANGGAWAISYHTSLVDIQENVHEIAMVIAHEFGHFILGDGSIHLLGGDKHTELLADKVGAKYLFKAGYSPCKAAKMWKRFQEEQGSDDGGETHPDFSKRINVYSKYCSLESRLESWDKLLGLK